LTRDFSILSTQVKAQVGGNPPKCLAGLVQQGLGYKISAKEKNKTIKITIMTIMASLLVTIWHLQSQTSDSLLPHTAVLDEPDTLDTDDIPTMPNEDDDGSESSSVEILDSGSHTDICKENELTRFSQILYDAQKRAFSEEKARGNKRKAYTGHSQKTAYRRKRFQNDLAAQGYFSIHEFMQRMKSQKSAEKVTPTFEESEESSDDNTVTWSNKLRTSEGMNVEELTPAQAALSEDRHQVAQGPAASEWHLRVQGLREEEEESTGSEDGGTVREDRKGVASRNGMYAALFQCHA
jgi:hypothetical protein